MNIDIVMDMFMYFYDVSVKADGYHIWDGYTASEVFETLCCSVLLMDAVLYITISYEMIAYSVVEYRQ